MGATTFSTQASGKTASEAFSNAVSSAAYEYGHGGYTGSIAEKHSFVLIGTEPDAASAYKKARLLLDSDDARINDKWGPAGAIRIAGTDEYVFFGWAPE